MPIIAVKGKRSGRAYGRMKFSRGEGRSEVKKRRENRDLVRWLLREVMRQVDSVRRTRVRVERNTRSRMCACTLSEDRFVSPCCKSRRRRPTIHNSVAQVITILIAEAKHNRRNELALHATPPPPPPPPNHPTHPRKAPRRDRPLPDTTIPSSDEDANFRRERTATATATANVLCSPRRCFMRARGESRG
jgi:hypothetical protein